MPTNIKKIFLSLIIVEMFFSYAPAFAQNMPAYDYATKAHVSSEIETFLCSPKIGGSSALYQCINQLYKFAIVLASVVGVFFIVIAGYIYMSSDGSSEAVDKAKDILTSTITAIVILLAGYVLLNALNPDLIQFHNVNPPAMQAVSVGTTGTTPSTGAGVSGSAAQIATSIQNTTNITLMNSHPSGQSDPASTAKQNIADVAQSKPAQNSCYTQNGITAPCNKNVSLNPSMLQAILNIGNQTPITVTEIAGGVHSSSPTDSHYTGNGFDIVPNNISLSVQGNAFTAISALGGTTIVECDIPGQSHTETTLTASNASTYNTCIGQPGYHIHGQWGGVDTTAAAPAQTQTPSPGILSFILPWNGPEVYPQIDWGNSDPNIDPGIKANLNELQNDFNSLNQNWQKEGHSAIQLNQVYRPQSYQAYYRSIWEINAIINNQDNTVGYQCDQTSHLDPAAVKAAYSQASAADKQTLQTKFNAHQVSGPTPAGCISDHASGIALDVLSPVSGSLYTQLIKESQNYGLCHNIAGDQPHYALLDKLSAGTNCNQQ